MVDIEALGIRQRQCRFKYLVLAVHDHFRNRQHIGRFIQEVKAANHVIVITDHFASQPHQISWLRAVTQYIGRTDQQLFQGLRRKTVPFTRFPERIRHVGKHGHMEMGTTTVFDGKQAEIVQIRSHEPVFRQTHAIAIIGLGHVASRGIRKVDFAAIAYKIKQSAAVTTWIRRWSPFCFLGDFRQDCLETAQ